MELIKKVEVKIKNHLYFNFITDMKQGRLFSRPLDYQAEKEEPHPQVVVALGLRITNCAPDKSSL